MQIMIGRGGCRRLTLGWSLVGTTTRTVTLTGLSLVTSTSRLCSGRMPPRPAAVNRLPLLLLVELVLLELLQLLLLSLPVELVPLLLLLLLLQCVMPLCPFFMFFVLWWLLLLLLFLRLVLLFSLGISLSG